jgi:hypothetical protein
MRNCPKNGEYAALDDASQGSQVRLATAPEGPRSPATIAERWSPLVLIVSVLRLH